MTNEQRAKRMAALMADVEKGIEESKNDPIYPHDPIGFKRLRADKQTIPAMIILTKSSVVKSGFKVAVKQGREQEWSLEALVVKYKDLFDEVDPLAAIYAKVRLNDFKAGKDL